MQKSIIVNTPTKNNHSDAQDWSSIFRSILGQDSGIINYSKNLKPSIVGLNQVSLESGVFSLQGHILKVNEGTTLRLDVPSGTLGQQRIDYVVAEYHKTPQLEDDTLEFKVISGIPAPAKPEPPKLTTGNVVEGATLVQVPVWELKLDGTVLKVNEEGNNAQILDNIETVKDKLPKDSGWKQLSPFNSSADYAEYRQIGNRVEVRALLRGKFKWNYEQHVLSLPVEVRPKNYCGFGGAGEGGVPFTVQAWKDGKVVINHRFTADDGIRSWCMFNISYLLD